MNDKIQRIMKIIKVLNIESSFRDDDFMRNKDKKDVAKLKVKSWK